MLQPYEDGFAQFEDAVRRLQGLAEVYLDYPVNAMTAACKMLRLPKKTALEAVAMFEMANGGGVATAHDVFIAMQEIMFLSKTQGAARHFPRLGSRPFLCEVV